MTATTATVRLRRRRRLLAVVALAAALSTSGVAWLASSGVVTLGVSAGVPPSGTFNGKTVDFVPLDPSDVSVPQGKGQLVSGIALGAAKFAAGYASGSKVDVAWLDPGDAGKVLNNPNAWLTFGLYYPIHTGACVSGDGSDAVTIGTSSLCATLDTAASGKLVNGGQLIVSKSVLSGFLRVGASDPTGSSPCSSTGSAWCTPSSPFGTTLSASQNLMYVVASINTPGGTPSGQQSQAGTLSFYMDVRPS